MTSAALRPQPPPLPHSATNGPWNIAAFLFGSVAYFLVMYRFQSYTERNNQPVGTFILFSAVVFVLGFLVGMFATRSPLLGASFLIAGVLAAHAVIIAVDLREDPTNHNLLPFEFVYLFLLCSPAYLGAWLSRFLVRLKS